MALIYVRRDTTANWLKAGNPVLQPGEGGLNTDTGEIFFGDGVTQYSDLLKTQVAPGGKSFALVDDTSHRLGDEVMAAVVDAVTDALPASDGVFVPALGAGLREFMARSEASTAAPSDVLWAGCSHSEGTGAGAFGSRYVDLLFGRMRRQMQPRGIVGGRGYLPAKYSEFTIPGPATTFGYPNSGNTGFGLGGRSLYMASDSSGIRFDAAAPLGQLNGTSFDVVYLPLGGGGSITVTIDGVAQAPFSTVGTQAEFSTKRFVFSSPGKHDVTIAHTDGTANIVLNGVVEYNGDEAGGLRFWDGSHFGWSTSTYVTNLVFPGAWRAQVAKIKPSLVGTDLHVNDYLNNIPVATMVSNYQKLITDANAGATFPPSIVILHGFEPKFTPTQEHQTPAAPWSAYGAALQQIVAAFPNQVTVVDISGVMPRPADDSTGLYNSDGTHCSAKGHALTTALFAQKVGL